MNRPYIAGIAGTSAGGKSTPVKRLEEGLSERRVRALHPGRVLQLSGPGCRV